MKRRKSNLKAKLESSLTYFSFKRLVPVGFIVGLIGSTYTALPLPSLKITLGFPQVLPPSFDSSTRTSDVPCPLPPPWDQRLTLVHFSAQRKHILWVTLCLRVRSMTRNG